MTPTKTRTGGPGSNADFAYSDTAFQRWCQAAGVLATKRQASKFRRGVGSAYKVMKGILPRRKETA